MAQRYNSYPVRLIRLSRLLLHVLSGLATAGIIFPICSSQRRNQAIIRWAVKLLAILHIRLDLYGDALAPAGAGCIIVANHISWLDIFLIQTVRPARFVAKSEIRKWPIAGWLCAKAGTLFIERTQRRHTAKLNEAMRDVVKQGGTVGLFPEGTTTRGDRLRKLHSSLFQAAIEAEAPLVPVAIHYMDEEGRRSEIPAYVDEISLLQSVAQIIATPKMCAAMHFGAPICTLAKTRRELSAETERALVDLLGDIRQ